jgi:predicted DNA-binding protein YlxM (UPF0122 family)
MDEKKVDKRLTRKVDNTLVNLELTKAEKEVLHLISDEFLTVKQICIRRQCSRQAVYKILKKLQKKGAYNTGLQRLTKSDPLVNLVNQNASKIRLHGQEFNIRILWQDNKYQQMMLRSNITFVDGNTVRLYKNAIEIYSGQAFFGDNEQDVTSKSLEYWLRFFTRLEHDLKIIIVKQKSANIKLVNQHYARTNSEISESALERGERIRIYAKEDGKLAFITDDSFGFKEDETVHPTTAKQDRKAVDKQVNDWRIYNPPTNSELAISIQDVTKNQMIFAENMRTHIGAIQELAGAVKELREEIKRRRKKDL